MRAHRGRDCTQRLCGFVRPDVRLAVETAIRGLGRLRAQHGIRARLLIVGGDSDDPDPQITPEIGRLRQIASAEGLDQDVVFVGRRDREQLRYYYSVPTSS